MPWRSLHALLLNLCTGAVRLSFRLNQGTTSQRHRPGPERSRACIAIAGCGAEARVAPAAVWRRFPGLAYSSDVPTPNEDKVVHVLPCAGHERIGQEWAEGEQWADFCQSGTLQGLKSCFPQWLHLLAGRIWQVKGQGMSLIPEWAVENKERCQSSSMKHISAAVAVIAGAGLSRCFRACRCTLL